MTVDAASADRPPRTAAELRGDYKLMYGLAIATGLIALIGWIWAGALALFYVSEHGSGSGNSLSCGTPFFFDRGDFAKTYDDNWANACADAIDRRIRQAVGIGVVATPVGALWVYSASQLPRLRAAAEAAAEKKEAESKKD